MPLINTSVPNLIQGVSQQTDAVRYEGQCEEQENAMSSVVDGLTKRPNTKHIGKLLSTAINSDSFVHFINRSETEKYVLIHNGTKLQAFNIITGLECSINGVANGGYTPSSTHYLNTDKPRQNLKALTIADNTILLNTNNVCVEDFVNKTPDVEKNVFAFVKQGDFAKKYRLSFDKFEPVQFSIVRSFTPPTVYAPPFFDSEFTMIHGGSGYPASTIVYGELTGNFNIQVAPSGKLKFHYETNSSGSVYRWGFSDSNTTSSTPTYGWFTINVAQTVRSANGPVTNLIIPHPQGSLAIGATEFTTESSTFNSSSGIGAQSTRIAQQLVSNAPTTLTDEYNITQKGNGIHFELKDTATVKDASVRAEDDLAGKGLAAIYRSVSGLDDLPLTCINEFKTKVTGDTDVDQDDYYVQFETANNGDWSAGSWIEAPAFDVSVGMLNSSLPHKIVNTALNTFTIDEIDYNDRTAGDDDSNPMPSFIQNKISGMFLFKNRLGFLSKDNIVMSESGNFFNFFRTSVRTILDADPIDIAVSSGKVTELRSAMGFQENLILFSTEGQFVLKGGSSLTPQTVSITPSTNFEYDDDVEPIPLGAYVYFPFNRGTHTGIREYTINSSTDVYDSTEITEHVPRFIGSDLIDFSGTSNEDLLAVVSGDDKDTIFMYKYFYNANKKILSSWFKFTFDGQIRGIEFIESTLHIVLVKGTETHLIEMALDSNVKDSDDVDHITHLDMRVERTVLNGQTSMTVLDYTPDDNTVQVYTKDGSSLSCTNSGATVTLNNAVTADTEVFVGIPYNMKYTFSTQLFKSKTSTGTSPTNAGKMQLRNGSIYYSSTAHFTVSVTPYLRNTFTAEFTPTIVDSSLVGDLALDTGFFRFAIFTKAEGTKITVENNSALPSNFQSAEFESFAHGRSQRYG